METTSGIDNTIYDHYGNRWYTAWDDPVALLRAENKVKFPWILEQLKTLSPKASSVLDVGCGGGFLSNELALQGYRVTGVDASSESLTVAQAHDRTGTVCYQVADAYQLPYQDASFDAVTAMDFLEHVERPKDVIREISRVLRKDGLFFFHTFNRNPLSHLVVIKFLEWFIKNTPRNMHVISLFITPEELESYCQLSQMKVLSMVGIRPKLSSIDRDMVRTGVVSKNMEFTLTHNTFLSYLGVARKK